MRPLAISTVLTLLIVISGNSWAAAAEIVWQRDVEQATRAAGRLNKPLLVEVSAVWCGYCVKMQQTTFRDEQVVKNINGCFVPVALDADADERTVNALGVRSLPATIVLSSDGKVLKHIAGFKTADQLGKELATFCARHEPGGRLELPVAEERPAENATGGIERVEQETAPVAFAGYCLVSMLDEEQLVAGASEHSAIHRGRTIHFASAAHLRRFEADPEKYWPALDGDCPVSAADENVRRPGDPRLAVVHRGRLWFFARKEREEKFFAAAEDYFRRLR